MSNLVSPQNFQNQTLDMENDNTQKTISQTQPIPQNISNSQNPNSQYYNAQYNNSQNQFPSNQYQNIPNPPNQYYNSQSFNNQNINNTNQHNNQPMNSNNQYSNNNNFMPQMQQNLNPVLHYSSLPPNNSHQKTIQMNSNLTQQSSIVTNLYNAQPQQNMVFTPQNQIIQNNTNISYQSQHNQTNRIVPSPYPGPPIPNPRPPYIPGQATPEEIKKFKEFSESAVIVFQFYAVSAFLNILLIIQWYASFPEDFVWDPYSGVYVFYYVLGLIRDLIIIFAFVSFYSSRKSLKMDGMLGIGTSLGLILVSLFLWIALIIVWIATVILILEKLPFIPISNTLIFAFITLLSSGIFYYLLLFFVVGKAAVFLAVVMNRQNYLGNKFKNSRRFQNLEPVKQNLGQFDTHATNENNQLQNPNVLSNGINEMQKFKVGTEGFFYIYTIQTFESFLIFIFLNMMLSEFGSLPGMNALKAMSAFWIIASILICVGYFFFCLNFWGINMTFILISLILLCVSCIFSLIAIFICFDVLAKMGVGGAGFALQMIVVFIIYYGYILYYGVRVPIYLQIGLNKRNFIANRLLKYQRFVKISQSIKYY